MDGKLPGHEGPLAEFATLRQEIERRTVVQHALFVLQLTASGAVFSFAFTGTGHSGFLLIIPISTYMLCARYVEQQYGIRRAATYIKDELSDRVPGGLGWEAWQLANPHFVAGSTVRRANALMITFPLIGLATLVWTVGTAFGNVLRLSVMDRVGLDVVWALGVIAVATCVQMVWSMLYHPMGDAPLPPIYRLPGPAAPTAAPTTAQPIGSDGASD